MSCPFCAYVEGRFSPELIAFEDAHVLVVPSKDQKRRNRGHCLVVPRMHIADLLDLPKTHRGSAHVGPV